MIRRIALLAVVVAYAAVWDAGVAYAGSGWAIEPTPNVPGAAFNFLEAVSCPRQNSCTAVGEATVSPGSDVTLAEHWNGRGWAIQPIPDPVGAASSILDGVSCPKAASCMAVGWYHTASGAVLSLAEHWDGTRWAVQPTPDPAGASSTVLHAVSCPKPDACTAVGYDVSSSGKMVTLAEHWDGTSWAIQPTPNPAGATSVGLGGVSCPKPAVCTAVGSYTRNFLNTSLAERWNGTRWVIQPVPRPAGASINFLQSVSCAKVTACTAAGTYFKRSNGAQVTLAEHWDGTGWAVQPTPSPPGATMSSLGSVSCAKAASCTAVGSSANPSRGISRTLAEHWDGTRWVIQLTPNPAVGNPTLTGASCRPGPSCTAVGSTVEPGVSGNTTTLAEHK